MRLKELRLKGFKSFANSTRISFEEQVVGVVGPNGAGKSNIVDSIKWILGEQKGKELRTDTKTDVIFNGTSVRKKASVAEAYLTFDNTKNILPTDYQTVEIGRVLYRSGDTEYMLNGTKCRRKDILNLFLDTGIGSNSYAIIQLGMVDDILFDKDNARHKMFEQAAGISKFKIRKRETMNKLKSTREDLERVKDILHELESNMKTLEKQAKRTKRFYELKEQYKELSIKLASSSYKVKSSQYEELKKKVTSEEDIYRDVKNKLLDLESRLEKSRTDNLSKEQTLSESQKEFNQLNDDLRTKENDKQINLQEIQFSENSLKKINSLLSSNTDELNKLKAELEPIQGNYQTKLDEYNLEKESFEVVEKRYNESKELLNSLQGDSDSQISMLQKYETEVFELEKELVVTENDLARTQAVITNLLLQISESKSQEAEFTQNLSSIREQESVLENKLAEFEIKAKNLREQFKSLEENIAIKSEKLIEINRKLDSKQNEHDLIKSMIDNLEGFPASTKFLVEKWKKTPILSNVIDAGPEYKTSLESYLTPYLNYFIVDKYTEAIEAVNLLSNAQKGKAQFFILEETALAKSAATCNIPGAIRASDVLDVDAKYKVLLDSLLEGVYFVDQWKDEYYSSIGEGVTILDKTGKYAINKRQLIGGSVGLFEGKKLGREKALKKLAKEIESLQAEGEVIEKELEELKTQKKSLGEKLESKENEPIQVELETVRSSRIQMETQLGTKSDFILNLNNQISSNESLISGFTEGLGSTKSRRDQAIATLEKFKSEREKATGEIDKIVEQSQTLTEEYNAANIALIKIQNSVESFDQDIKFKTERISRLTEELDAAKQESIQLNESIVNCNAKSEELELALKALYEKKQGMAKDLSDTEQNYFSERSSINELENDTQKTRRTLNEKQVSINELKSEVQNYKFEISAIRERLSIEFQMEKDAISKLLEDAMNQEVEEVEEGLELKVGKLKSRLENYGDINPLAVTAYEEVKERFDMIEGQRNDILEAEASLLATIGEIETTASEKFLDAFNKVNGYFSEVFRGLFTEDDMAEIRLEDPENPLESNIEIIAKPKGKRPTTLKQLSGGERTLTATALLFSLYLLKPAPFCIFDEVDAPLDDSNIQKFVRLIKKFSLESQFVIITHNKATMAAVDTLYGVYMQEKGVSEVAQVDFREYEHQEKFQSANVG